MRCPLADDAAPAVPAGSSGHATPAVGLLRVPLKRGPKPRFSQEQKKARHVLACRADRKRKKEEHAALEARAKKAEDSYLSLNSLAKPQSTSLCSHAHLPNAFLWQRKNEAKQKSNDRLILY